MIQHIADYTITDKHGVTYQVTSRSAYGEIEFRAYSTGKCIALAELPYRYARYVSNVLTTHAFRRRGIATALYDLIERVHNITLRPSPILLYDGQAFWCARDASRLSSVVIIDEEPNADVLTLL